MQKKILSMAIIGLMVLASEHTWAAVCSPEKLQEVLQPASSQSYRVNLNCSLTLPKNAVVTKQLVWLGDMSSNTTLDGNGATVNASMIQPSVLITSQHVGNDWLTPQHIVIKNLSVTGSLRIQGMAENGQGEYLKESSHHAGHTERAQAAAPSHITLDNLTVQAGDHNVLYFAPGVHDITLQNSQIFGHTSGLALYLDAESANNSIENNVFNVQTKTREVIAIDGSAHNVIEHNQFINPNHGAIYLYRNCGEGGTVRHQTPSNNQIVQNQFKLGSDGKLPVIWIASRNGHKSYCSADDGYPFGSSLSDLDLATDNTVSDNTFSLKSMSRFWLWLYGGDKNVIRVNAQPNMVTENHIQH